MKLKQSLVGSSILISFVYVSFHIARKLKTHTTEKFVPYQEEENLSRTDFRILTFFDIKLLSSKDFAKDLPVSGLPNKTLLLIHFVEGHGHSALPPRLWCSVEAATRLNPTALVLLHMRSPHLLLTAAAKSAMTATNLRVFTIDQRFLFSESPLKQWYENKVWEKSAWPMSFFTDALRWLLLYHFGGIYIDLDAVSIRTLTPPEFPYTTFAAKESEHWVGPGVAGVEDPKHWLPKTILENYGNAYESSDSAFVGPQVLTKALQRRCPQQLPDNESATCEDFNILLSRTFYPIPWFNYKALTQADPGNAISYSLFGDPKVRTVHFWHQHTQKHTINILRPKVTVRYPKQRNSVSHSQVSPNDSQHANDSSTIRNIDDQEAVWQPLGFIASIMCPSVVASAANNL